MLADYQTMRSTRRREQDFGRFAIRILQSNAKNRDPEWASLFLAILWRSRMAKRQYFQTKIFQQQQKQKIWTSVIFKTLSLKYNHDVI